MLGNRTMEIPRLIRENDEKLERRLQELKDKEDVLDYCRQFLPPGFTIPYLSNDRVYIRGQNYPIFGRIRGECINEGRIALDQIRSKDIQKNIEIECEAIDRRVEAWRKENQKAEMAATTVGQELTKNVSLDEIGWRHKLYNQLEKLGLT